MTSQGNGQSIPYDVRLSAQTKAVLKRLHQEAMQRGAGHAFLAACRQIMERLTNDPLTFGEPLYRLPALQLAVRHAAVLPLVVDYAVHEHRPIVFIRGFKVLS
ncbi:MAG: hypothetical protein L0Z62_00285 [Gemmataceae bacterium]|nr:hypothetical protein [Gemmataceae bacterium]